MVDYLKINSNNTLGGWIIHMIKIKDVANDYKRIMAGCFFSFFVNGMLALILGAILPAILTDYNMGYNQGGILLSFHAIGNLLSSILIGVISVYIGRKNTIVVISTMSIIGFGGMLITKSPAILLLLFFITGIDRGSVSNIINTVVNDISEKKSAPLNILHAFFAIGAFVALFISSWFFAIGLSWRYSVIFVIIFAALRVIIFSLMKIDNTRGTGYDEKRDQKTSHHFIKNISFYVTCGMLFFYIGIEYATNGWLITYLKDTGIMDTSLAQRTLSILWVIIAFGRLSVAHISKFITKKNILLVSSTGTMIFFALFLMSTSIWSIVLCIFGLGFCMSGIYSTAISNVGSIIKGNGLAMGILLGAAGLGGIAMPYITGVIAEIYGIASGMFTIIVAIVLLFLLTLTNKLQKSELD